MFSTKSVHTLVLASTLSCVGAVPGWSRTSQAPLPSVVEADDDPDIGPDLAEMIRTMQKVPVSTAMAVVAASGTIPSAIAAPPPPEIPEPELQVIHMALGTVRPIESPRRIGVVAVGSPSILSVVVDGNMALVAALKVGVSDIAITTTGDDGRVHAESYRVSVGWSASVKR